STHFSGDGFSDMHFQMRAVTQDAFEDWIRSARGSGPALDEGAYAELVKQSTADPPRTWSAVTPTLFEQIVTLRAPAGPGPGPGTAPPEVRPSGGGHNHAR